MPLMVPLAGPLSMAKVSASPSALVALRVISTGVSLVVDTLMSAATGAVLVPPPPPATALVLGITAGPFARVAAPSQGQSPHTEQRSQPEERVNGYFWKQAAE